MTKIALLFPGQGAQTVGMGRELVAAYPTAQAVYAQADEVLGFPLSRIILDGPESELNPTDVAQPALLTAEVAAWRALTEGWKPPADSCLAAGHSLGEYAALVAAGVLDFADALRLVRLRGRLMQRAAAESTGGMAAVMGQSPEAVEALCREADPAGGIQVANFNAPGQQVVSGSGPALERFEHLAGERKMKWIPLKVSGPFHSRHMISAGRDLAPEMEHISWNRPVFPVIANVTAEPVTEPQAFRELLIRQVSSSVQWEASVRRMVDLGVERAVEIGPGRVLRGLLKKTAPQIQVQGAFLPEEISRIGQFLAAVA